MTPRKEHVQHARHWIQLMTKRSDEILREMMSPVERYCCDPVDQGFIRRNLRTYATRLAAAEGEPQGIELVKQLRDALGIADTARPESPQTVWIETLGIVQRMRADAEVMRTKIAAAGLGPTRTAEVDALLHEQIGAAQADEEAAKREIEKRIERLEKALVELAEDFRGHHNAAPSNYMDTLAEWQSPLGEIAREVAKR